MKKIISILTCIPSLVFAQSSIQGKIASASNSNARVYLQYSVSDKTMLDSTKLNNGRFVFHQIPIHNATKAILIISPDGEPLKVFSNKRMANGKKILPPDFVDLFIDKGDQILISGGDSLKNSKIEGSNLNIAYKSYQNELKSTLDQLKELTAKVRKIKSADRNNAKIMQPLEDQRKSLVDDLATKNLAFAKSHPNDYFALVALTEYLRAKPTSVNDIAPVFQSLSAAIKKEPLAAELSKTIQGNKNTSIGATIPDFQQNDFLNRAVSIKDFRGKYTLIYFWASWCTTCREANEEINRIYKAYNDKGFEVLGVSLDKEKAEWVKALRADELLFINVSDINGWDNTVATKLGIKRIPDNILIDSAGKIIAKNLTTGEIRETLTRVLPKN